MSEILYLKLEKISLVKDKTVRLGQVATLWCSDKALEERLSQTNILEIERDEDHRYVMSVISVIEKINGQEKDLQVSNLGETEFIIDYQPGPGSSDWWNWVKTIFVCVTMLIGGAFAIMTFNNDGCVAEIFQQLYRSAMGAEPEGVNVLEIGYSVGLPLGILLFFNHFSKVSFSKDPTPIEVQMRSYENDVNDTLIQNAGREETGIDVS